MKRPVGPSFRNAALCFKSSLYSCVNFSKSSVRQLNRNLGSQILPPSAVSINYESSLRSSKYTIYKMPAAVKFYFRMCLLSNVPAHCIAAVLNLLVV